MTTGNSIPNERKSNGPSPEPIPYFGRSDTTLGLWNHIFSHLQLKRRESTVNPYLDRAAGFHTVFYEIRKGNDLKLNELWKHGPLYDHPLGWSFRKSAYTVSSDPLNGRGRKRLLTGLALLFYETSFCCNPRGK